MKALTETITHTVGVQLTMEETHAIHRLLRSCLYERSQLKELADIYTWLNAEFGKVDGIPQY